ncbi:MAG: hypothetical protein A3F67_08060 [Verrucomicrobia bacterium RIFCSPHIGHO2_12_FULL_41_10]|nr:MAG: hypothetical protein A3F67_08060 [Verrucomicrobia bacterium RIFCSPHIGHO2_12_FULL_41_10]
MGRFLTTLKTEQITEGTLLRKAKFKLTSPLVYQSGVLNDTIIVPEGFVTDFATVPRLPIVYALLGNLGNAAACLHDFLYTAPHGISAHAVCNAVSRKLADQVLKEATIDGMVSTDSNSTGTWQSIKNIFYNLIGSLFYIGVRIGGTSHWGK